MVNDRSATAFTATLAGAGVTVKNKSGLWWGQPSSFALVTRLGTRAPDADGIPSTARFGKFISLALPNGPAGAPVFVARVSGPEVTAKTNTGLWAVDTAGHLRQLLRTGDLVEGQPHRGCARARGRERFARCHPRGFNAGGTLVLRVPLPHGQHAILQIEIPEGR